jgi:uncharacterized protein (DUF779 family)
MKREAATYFQPLEITEQHTATSRQLLTVLYEYWKLSNSVFDWVPGRAGVIRHAVPRQ